MADVNHLEEGVDPPNEPCVVVTRDITGWFYVVSSETGLRCGARRRCRSLRLGCFCRPRPCGIRL